MQFRKSEPILTNRLSFLFVVRHFRSEIHEYEYRMRWIFHFLLFSLSICVVSSKQSNEKCSRFNLHPKPVDIQANHTYNLWPGLANSIDLKSGEVLPGFYEAMEVIWKNQNPTDCRNASYLIAEGFHQGFGSEFHVYGVVLALAVDLGRVLLQHGGWTWRYKNPFCEKSGKKDLDCYYYPWSKCTLQDAAAVAFRDQPLSVNPSQINDWTLLEDQKLQALVIAHGVKGNWRKFAKEIGTKTPTQCGNRWWTVIRERLKSRARGDPVLKKVVFDDDRSIADYKDLDYLYPFHRVLSMSVKDGNPIFHLPHGDRFSREVIAMGQEVMIDNHDIRRFVPRRFHSLLSCAGMSQNHYYLWWRAISVSFLLRPNLETQAWIEKHSDEVLRRSQGQCISTYIRHGDKHLEMHLIPTQKYTAVAERIWERKEEIPGIFNRSQRLFYVASEDLDAIRQIKIWGSQKNVTVRASNISQVILSDRIKEVKQSDLEKAPRKNRQFEYLSYLLHLAETMRCEVLICTYPSNYCRVIDELRTTLGGKANRLTVDLSIETCPSTPCIRSHGLGSLQPAEVHDPKGKLWR